MFMAMQPPLLDVQLAFWQRLECIFSNCVFLFARSLLFCAYTASCKKAVPVLALNQHVGLGCVQTVFSDHETCLASFCFAV